MNAVFKLGQFRRVDLQIFRVVSHAALQLCQFNPRRFEALKQVRRGRIDLLQFLDAAADLAQAVDHAAFALAQPSGDRPAQLGQPCAVRRDAVPGLDLLLLAILQRRRANLIRLELQHVELLGADAFGIFQFIELRDRRAPFPPGGLILRPHVLDAGKFVQHVELPLPGIQGLMIVRPVQIDQKLAEALQHLNRHRRAVHELLVRTAGADGAFDQQFPVLAGLQSRLIEHRVDFPRVFQVKTRLHRAGVLPVADEAAVRPLTQDQLQSAHDDRLSRSRLPGHAHQPCGQFPGHIFDESQVANFENGKHAAGRGVAEYGMDHVHFNLRADISTALRHA